MPRYFSDYAPRGLGDAKYFDDPEGAELWWYLGEDVYIVFRATPSNTEEPYGEIYSRIELAPRKDYGRQD